MISNNINISLVSEIENSEFEEEIKKEALKILNHISMGDSDEKIKNKINDDFYEMIAKQNVNEVDKQ